MYNVENPDIELVWNSECCLGEVAERTGSLSSDPRTGYRFGFNGKESDREGEWDDLTHYDYGFRIYNPGIARFLSVDPLTHSYPWYTPYQFAGNTPIHAIDLDGLEPTRPRIHWDIDPELEKKLWGDIEKTNIYITIGVHQGDYLFEESPMMVAEKWDSEKTYYQYYDKKTKDWYYFTPAGMYEPDDVVLASAYLFCATAGALTVNWKLLMWSTSYELGASALTGDLGNFDYIDAVAGGYGFIPEILIGSTFDWQHNGEIKSMYGVVGDKKEATNVLIDASLGAFGKAAENYVKSFSLQLKATSRKNKITGMVINELAGGIDNFTSHSSSVLDYTLTSAMRRSSGNLNSIGSLLDATSKSIDALLVPGLGLAKSTASKNLTNED